MLYLRSSPSGGLFKKWILGLNFLQKVENRYSVHNLFSMRSKKIIFDNIFFVIVLCGPGSFAATRKRSCRYVAKRLAIGKVSKMIFFVWKLFNQFDWKIVLCLKKPLVTESSKFEMQKGLLIHEWMTSKV